MVTKEQRQQAVALVRAGAPVRQVAKELGVSPQSVYTWLKRYPKVPITGAVVSKPKGFFGRLWSALGF